MENHDEARRKNEPQEQSKVSTDYSRWIAEQLTVLELALDIKLTDERKQLYVSDLSRANLSREQLGEAFTKARMFTREYFPKVGEILAYAGATAAEPDRVESVEANAAWNQALRYAEEHGVNPTPTYSRGMLVMPPPLPPRIEYALRRIGGLRALRDIDEKNAPFMLRDFIAGYNEFPLCHVEDRPQLRQQEVKQLMPSPEEIARRGQPVSFSDIAQQLHEIANKMPDAPQAEPKPRIVTPRAMPPVVPLTREQIAKRRPAELAEIEAARKEEA